MEYRILGRTGLKVSSMGLGSGGPSQFGQRSGIPEAEIHRLVRVALDEGINLFDTSAAYGESEALLGRALEGSRRENYYLATKFPPHEERTGGPFRGAQEMQESLERSLRRLKVESLDLFQFHGVRPEDYQVVCEELVPAAEKLRKEGKFRFLGVSERYATDGGGHSMLLQALKDGHFDTIMVGYNLLNPSAEREVLPLAAQKNIGVLVMCAVRRVLASPDRIRELIADLKGRGIIDRDSLPDDNPLGWLVQGEVDSIPAAAYKFVHAHPAVSCLLSGTSRIEHLRANLAAVLGPPLPEAGMARLRAVFGQVNEPLGN